MKTQIKVKGGMQQNSQQHSFVSSNWIMTEEREKNLLPQTHILGAVGLGKVYHTDK